MFSAGRHCFPFPLLFGISLMPIVEWMRRWSVQHPSVLVIALVMYIASVPGSNNDIIYQMPMFGSRVHPKCLNVEFVFLPEQGIGDKKVVL